ncbi:hypothetical protein [Rufibacter tibetensis]|uniref:Glycosyltransferase RgtA/B/C/D-like domain-containing protein n=1 Tax=Rufibacter tibetensis TaxID=512763 RepID=A0A0P0C9Y3_9BACT|nr:hypothetical protein [Rufibacter tibetensis]ALJ00429.1 hypothetical protein DC20_17445 [Rufibacter tibetensis]
MALRTSSLLQSRLLPISVILFLFLMYAFLPTQNSTTDAYDYAASVRWRVDLWKPHHLLYNITALAFYSLLQSLGVYIMPLPLLKLLNSFFAGTSLFVLWRMIALLQKDVKVQAALLLVAGASFGTMRYATENETYLIPLFFSSLGSLYALRYLQLGKGTFIFWSGWWASIACLYHQVHFFWWLGLFFFFLLADKCKLASAFRFLLPALVVPLVYGLVMFYQDIRLTEAHRFVFSAFYKGGVETTITYKNFLLTGISFFRTFFEVHGRIPFLLTHHPFYIINGLVTAGFVLYLLKELLQRRRTNILHHSTFYRTHAVILALQVLFAWYAVGNAEFMVMVPFLVVLLASCLNIKKSRNLFLFGIALFIWNTSFGVIPNHLYTFSNHACVSNYIQQHPGSVLILHDKNAFDTYFFYHFGRYPENTHETEAPARVLTKVIAEGHLRNQAIITDYTKEAAVLNRQWFLSKKKADAFFKNYELSPFYSCPTFYRGSSLHKVSVHFGK